METTMEQDHLKKEDNPKKGKHLKNEDDPKKMTFYGVFIYSGHMQFWQYTFFKLFSKISQTFLLYVKCPICLQLCYTLDIGNDHEDQNY